MFCETVIGVFRHSLGILPVPAPGPRPRPTPLSELTQSQRRVTLRSLYSTGYTLVNKQVVAPGSRRDGKPIAIPGTSDWGRHSVPTRCWCGSVCERPEGKGLMHALTTVMTLAMNSETVPSHSKNVMATGSFRHCCCLSCTILYQCAGLHAFTFHSPVRERIPACCRRHGSSGRRPSRKLVARSRRCARCA